MRPSSRSPSRWLRILRRALILAILMELAGCATGRPVSQQKSLDDRMREYRDGVQAYNKQALALKQDVETVTAEARALSKHPAFPTLWKKFEEAVARSIAEEPTDKAKQGVRAEEFLATVGLTPDEEKVRQAMQVEDTRIQWIKFRTDALDQWRLALASDRDAILQEIERRRLLAAEEAADARQLASITALMGALRPAPPPPRFQTSCATNRIGGMVYTNCW
jgi:hypothetical protein